MAVDILIRENLSEEDLLPFLKKVATLCLQELNLNQRNLSILVTNDAEIKELNRDFRNKDKPTDVLSFSMDEGEGVLGENHLKDLGDVVISLDTASTQARECKVSLKQELSRLLIHGILHLAGYEHENVSEERVREMEEKEKEIFLLTEGLSL